MSEAGKGSKRRPRQVTLEEYAARWDQIHWSAANMQPGTPTQEQLDHQRESILARHERFTTKGAHHE